MGIFSLLTVLETYVVLQIYLAALRDGRKDRKFTFEEALLVTLVVLSPKTHYIFILSMHNDFFSVAFGYLAILSLQHSRVGLCLLFFR